jgi:hypothetical protein
MKTRLTGTDVFVEEFPNPQYITFNFRHVILPPKEVGKIDCFHSEALLRQDNPTETALEVLSRRGRLLFATAIEFEGFEACTAKKFEFGVSFGVAFTKEEVIQHMLPTIKLITSIGFTPNEDLGFGLEPK